MRSCFLFLEKFLNRNANLHANADVGERLSVCIAHPSVQSDRCFNPPVFNLGDFDDVCWSIYSEAVQFRFKSAYPCFILLFLVMLLGDRNCNIYRIVNDSCILNNKGVSFGRFRWFCNRQVSCFVPYHKAVPGNRLLYLYCVDI